MDYKYNSRYFKYHESLIKHLNEYKIKQEDIISIASEGNGFVLFYKVNKKIKEGK